MGPSECPAGLSALLASSCLNPTAALWLSVSGTKSNPSEKGVTCLLKKQGCWYARKMDTKVFRMRLLALIYRWDAEAQRS